MSELSAWQESELMDAIFANTAPSSSIDGPTLALWGVSPANDPNFANELDSTQEYSRLTTASGDWTVSSTNGPRSYQNSVLLDFGVLNSGAQVTVEGLVAIRPDNTEAVFYDGDFTEVVDAGQKFEVEANNATFSLD